MRAQIAVNIHVTIKKTMVRTMKATVPFANMSNGSPTADAVTPLKTKQRLSKSIKIVVAVAFTVAAPVGLIHLTLISKILFSRILVAYYKQVGAL